MSLDYLSCFAVVLRGIDGKVDICQADYSTHSKEVYCILKSYMELQHSS